MADKPICVVSDCGKLVRNRGLCDRHYRGWRERGFPTPLPPTVHRPALNFIDAAVASATDECIDWPFATTASGYPLAATHKRQTTATRIICDAAHGSPPSPHHQAAHSCGRPICVNPRHLRWATPTQNHADKWGHGTMNIGGRNGSAKLTEAQVRAVRALKGQVSQSKIAKRFGVSRALVGLIHQGHAWGWLP